MKHVLTFFFKLQSKIHTKHIKTLTQTIKKRRKTETNLKSTKEIIQNWIVAILTSENASVKQTKDSRGAERN